MSDKNNFPKISIVTPSFNQGMFLEETILSVLNQNYPNLEYIIIDGGSTDNTVEIIKKYEKHLTYWISEPDKGQSDALNKGIRLITGDIFNWLNSDDFLEPNALFKIAINFNNKPLIVTGKSRILQLDGNTYLKKGHNLSKFDEKAYALSLLFQPSTFISTKIIPQLGFLSTNLHYVMDVEWYLKFFLYFGYSKIKEIDDIIVNYRHHSESKSVKYQPLFWQEINFLFYHLSLNIGAIPEAKFISNYILNNEIKTLRYRIQLNPEYFNFDIIINQIHNFIFEFMPRFWKQGDFSIIKEAYTFINPNNLTTINLCYYEVYKTKINYYLPLIKTKRLIKNIFNRYLLLQLFL